MLTRLDLLNPQSNMTAPRILVSYWSRPDETRSHPSLAAVPTCGYESWMPSRPTMDSRIRQCTVGWILAHQNVLPFVWFPATPWVPQKKLLPCSSIFRSLYLQLFNSIIIIDLLSKAMENAVAGGGHMWPHVSLTVSMLLGTRHKD